MIEHILWVVAIAIISIVVVDLLKFMSEDEDDEL